MPKKVLIAEDNALLIKMYQRFFEDECAELDIEVQLAFDGQQAIDSIEQSQPDLLLLDLLMPEVDGFDVLEFRKHKGYSFPVVILSNLSKDIDVKRCKEMGVADYFVKSDMDLSDLGPLIKKHI